MITDNKINEKLKVPGNNKTIINGGIAPYES
jgi:hypothetical protein